MSAEYSFPNRAADAFLFWIRIYCDYLPCPIRNVRWLSRIRATGRMKKCNKVCDQTSDFGEIVSWRKVKSSFCFESGKYMQTLLHLCCTLCCREIPLFIRVFGLLQQKQQRFPINISKIFSEVYEIFVHFVLCCSRGLFSSSRAWRSVGFLLILRINFYGDTNPGCHGAWLNAKCPSRKLSDKF